MLEGFFTPGADGPDSYESLQRKRKMADALLAQSQDGAPIQSWTQGGAKLIQALSGSLQNRSLDAKERESSKAFNETLMRALGGQSGGGMPSAPAMGGGASLPSMASGGSIPKMVMPDPVSGNLDTTQKALLNAIAAPESAGAYNIRYTPKGGATFAGFDAHPGVFEPGPAGPSSAAGRYQFTKTTWDRMGGGAFTPENQDQRALALASQDYKSRTGRELMADIQANGFTPQIAQALGPTWRGLVDNPQKAMAAFQATMQRGQQAPVQTAQTGTTPDGMQTSPVASDAPPMAYAPAQQAIAGAMPQAGGPPMPPRRPESFGGAPMPVDPAQQPAQGQRLAQAVTSPPIPAPQPTGNVQQAMMAVLSDPRFSPQQKSQAMQMFQMTQSQGQVKPIDMGNQIGLIDARGNVVRTIPKQKDAQFGVIGQDQFGNNQYGFISADTGQVRPVQVPGQAPQGQAMQPAGPDGSPAPSATNIPPPPPGVDPVAWRRKFTEKAAEDAQGPKSEEITSLRKEVQQLPSYKNAAQAAPIYSAMTRAADVDSKAADLDLVYGLAKIFDPTSVVREGEMVMVTGTAGLPAQLMGLINSVNGGARLTPETRAAVMNQAHNRMQSYSDQFKQDSEFYTGVAGRRKIDVRDILPSFGTFSPWRPKPAQGAGVDPTAAQTPASGFTAQELQAEIERRRQVRERAQ